MRDLLRKTLEKFRDSASVLESALDRGVPPSQRDFVRSKIVPALVGSGFIEGIFRGPKRIYKRVESRNASAWALVDRGEEDSQITAILDSIAPHYR